MNPVASFRAAHLLPYVEFLRKTGAPVDRGLHQAKLPTMLSDQLDAYLPLLPTIDFLKAMSKSEGIDDIGLRALQNPAITDFSKQFVAAANCSPTLLVALGYFRKLVSLDDVTLQFWISADKNTVKLCCLNRCPLDAQGLHYKEWSELLAVLAIVRAFAEPTWHPKEMAFRSNVPPSRFASQQLPNTRFLVGQKAAWITMPRDMLSLPPPTRLDTAPARLNYGSTTTPSRHPMNQRHWIFPLH